VLHIGQLASSSAVPRVGRLFPAVWQCVSESAAGATFWGTVPASGIGWPSARCEPRSPKLCPVSLGVLPWSVGASWRCTSALRCCPGQAAVLTGRLVSAPVGGSFAWVAMDDLPQRESVPIGARCIGSRRPYGSRPDAAGRIHHVKRTCIMCHYACMPTDSTMFTVLSVSFVMGLYDRYSSAETTCRKKRI
jgi:hypothetical protein